jgi:uncharacterized protein (TIGR02246 family)
MSHETAIDQLLQSFAESFNQRDAARLASLFTEDGDVVNIVAVRMAGRGGIEAGHARHFAAALSASRLSFTGRTLRQIAPGVVLCHAAWRREALDDGPNKLPPGEGLMTLVAVEQAGSWKLTAQHNTQAGALPVNK